MPKLPVITPKKLLDRLKKLGFFRHGKMRGSHLIMKHRDGRRTTIPMHGKDIPKGTLKAILRDIDVSRKQIIQTKNPIDTIWERI